MSFNKSLLLIIVAAVFAADPAPSRAQNALRPERAPTAGRIESLIHQMRHRLVDSPVSSTRLQAPAPDAASFGIAQTGGIAGNVAGLTDDALASAIVMAWTDSLDGSTGEVSVAKVLPDGTYRMAGLAPGAYWVAASADGYEITFYDNVRDFSDASQVVVADAEVEGIDFRMVPMEQGTASISGTVRSDADQQPVADAYIYAFDPNGMQRTGYATSSPDGTYEIAGLQSGTYIVQVIADRFLQEFYDDAALFQDADPVVVAEGAAVTGIDFSLSAGGSISGVVVDRQGAPVVGASVSAMIHWRSDSTVVGWPDVSIPEPGFFPGNWTQTDHEGRYRIEGLPTGSYLVYAQSWSQWSYAAIWFDGASVPDDAMPVPVVAGEEVTGINMVLPIVPANSAIAGRVTDADGDPVPEAFVTAEQIATIGDPNWPVGYGYAVTDRDGKYLIEGITAGTYRVSASAQIGWEYVQRWHESATNPDEATPVPVAESEKVEGIDVILPESGSLGSISGVIRDAQGTPLVGAFVEAMPHGETGSGQNTGGGTDPSGEPGADGRYGSWGYSISDSSGAYTIDRLVPGTYAVHASYWTEDRFGQSWYDGAETVDDATPIVLGEDEDVTGIDLALDVRPMYGTVAGTVTNGAGLPVTRAFVELSPIARDLFTDAPFWHPSTYAVTNERGEFKIDRVPQGNYIVAVYSNSGSEYFDDASSAEEATPIEVVGGSTHVANFSLTARADGTGEIQGIVTGAPYAYDASGTARVDSLYPLEIAVVLAYPADGNAPGNIPGKAYTAVTGTDGSYRLTGLAAGDYVVYSFAPWHVGEYYEDVYSPDQATLVRVDGTQPATGIDFELWPGYFLAPETDAGRSAVVVYGVVTDANGTPVEGASVYVLGADEQPLASARTGADGTFEISGLLPGNYNVYAGKIGYQGAYNGNAPSYSDATPIAMSGGRVQVNLTMQSGIGTGVEEEPTLPQGIELLGNYPNPFNPETAILFRLSEPTAVRLTVYNVLGEEVAVLVDGPVGAGLQTIRWNGESSRGTPVASGAYYYRVETESTAVTSSMVLVR